MKADRIENSELGELWSMYSGIRAQLTARIEAEIKLIEKRLMALDSEPHGELLAMVKVASGEKREQQV